MAKLLWNVIVLIHCALMMDCEPINCVFNHIYNNHRIRIGLNVELELLMDGSAH